MNYYISDTHFGHANIMRLCNRPFTNIEEQDKTIIKNWNSKVTENDTVYILGDFCYKSGRHPADYLKQLNGKKVLILGNHDGAITKDIRNLSRYFEEITPYKEIYEDKTKIVLCHYPIIEWNGFFHEALHFYGHIHNNIENQAYKLMKNVENAYNVGADILDFTPQTKDDVIKLNKEFDLKVAKDQIFRVD